MSELNSEITKLLKSHPVIGPNRASVKYQEFHLAFSKRYQERIATLIVSSSCEYPPLCRTFDKNQKHQIAFNNSNARGFTRFLEDSDGIKKIWGCGPDGSLNVWMFLDEDHLNIHSAEGKKPGVELSRYKVTVGNCSQQPSVPDENILPGPMDVDAMLQSIGKRRVTNTGGGRCMMYACIQAFSESEANPCDAVTDELRSLAINVVEQAWAEDIDKTRCGCNMRFALRQVKSFPSFSGKVFLTSVSISLRMPLNTTTSKNGLQT